MLKEVMNPETLITPEDVETIFRTPLDGLQLNFMTILVILMFVGRIGSYLKTNGGVKNILLAIWEGGITGSKTQRKVDTINEELVERIQELEKKINVD